MQLELKRIQREVGITFIFVTHDQEEALTMSDRIAVMSRGNVEQIGTPDRDLRPRRRASSSPASSARPTCCRDASTAATSGAPVAVLDSRRASRTARRRRRPRRRSGHRDAAPRADHRRRRPARRRPQPAGGRQGRHLPGLVELRLIAEARRRHRVLVTSRPTRRGRAGAPTGRQPITCAGRPALPYLLQGRSAIVGATTTDVDEVQATLDGKDVATVTAAVGEATASDAATPRSTTTASRVSTAGRC